MWLLTSAFAATLQVPADYSTIQEALDASADGDEIEVAAGTYSEDLTVTTEVFVRGDGDVKVLGKHLVEVEQAGFEGLDLTGNGSDACLRVASSEFYLEDARVSGCVGGIVSTEPSNIWVFDSEFVGNASYDGAGAILVADGGLAIENSAFRGNSTTYGAVGGVQVSGGLVLQDCEFSGNSGYSGAGAVQVTGDLFIANSLFEGNSTTYGNSGGIAAVGGAVEIDDSVFTDHAGYNGGGALYVQGGDLAISSTSFENSTTTYNVGGAIAWLDGDFLRMSDVTATGGSAQNGGGLLFARGGSIELVRVWLEEGQTTYGEGGVAALTGNSVEVHNSVFRGGSAQGAGVLYVGGESASIVNNDVLDGTSSYGASLVALASGYTDFVNNIGAFADGTPVSVTGTVDPAHNAWFELGEAALIEGELDVLEDCAFVSYPDDLHLAEGSPCIDAGHPDLLDADGSPSDIGAFGGPDSEAPVDTGDTGGDSGPSGDSGGSDTGVDGDVKLEGSGVRGFCGCNSGNALILLGFLMLFRRFTRDS